MPKFSYRAYDERGDLYSGELICENREIALDALRQRKSYAVELTEADTAPAKKWWDIEISSGRVLSPNNLQVFTRELATFVSAKLPLDDTLRILAVQPLIPRKCQRLVQDLLDRVLAGASLAEAIAAHGKNFPDYYCKLIAAGERSGNLEPVLMTLANFLDRRAAARSRIQSALIYPIFLLIAAVAALGLIVSVLVPTIAPLFEDAGIPPPAMIAFLLEGQRLLSTYWPILCSAFVVLVFTTVGLSQNQVVKELIDELSLSVPLVGSYITRRETARFSASLAMLLTGGVPMLEASRIAGESLSNLKFKKAALMARDHLESGGALSEQLQDSGVFPPLSIRLIAVGERTGQLATMLSRLSAIEEGALQRDLDRITTLIAPILTVSIGLFVGIVILSVMGAVVSLNDLALQ